MSCDQVTIYKYGGRAQPAEGNNSIVVARHFFPKSRSLQRYRSMSSEPSMSGTFNNSNPQWTQEQIREFKRRKLEEKRALVLANILGGVARDPEQEEYEEYLQNCQARGAVPTSSYGTSECQDSGDIQYKSAQILDPTRGRGEEVTVIEDSACRVNFISPRIARLCNITHYPTPPIEHGTMTGRFVADRWAEVTWLGNNGNSGSDWFYIAPEEAPLELEILVGTQFMKDHPNVFPSRKLLAPSMLTVQTKLRKEERAQVQADKVVADAYAVELEKRKQEKARQVQQKPKQSGSSSRSSRTRKS
ncbi:uncharacterized protein LY89DRAFT_724806 [Mollisia scopiformis]|uniref:Uncharacterized protein n=1 Tax=Mollisia scopiformis TaxID=149040 RepID=A0A132B972_MOLSC|nr:uncharacterized protein LY89DRAFT_724806 [Mollisia scopiformis]KUJ08803.1 hypothetical protein LY89DRAFT_724806 [Mollisia scopiformis]